MQLEPKLNAYSLSRQWVNFVKEHQDIITPVHWGVFYWTWLKNNQLNWNPVFGLPTMEAMKMLGIKDRRTFRKALSDLESWGFIKVISKSTNQNNANQVALALDAQPENNALALDAQPECMKCISEPEKEGVACALDAPIIKHKNKPLYKHAFGKDFSPIDIYDSLAFKLWKLCYESRIEQNIKPTILERAKPEAWAKTIKLIIEKDNRTESEITEILDYVKNDQFWINNIQSPDNLRKHFEKLQLQMRTQKTSKQRALSTNQKISEMNYSEKA